MSSRAAWLASSLAMAVALLTCLSVQVVGAHQSGTLLDLTRLSRLDAVVSEAIAAHRLPGAVVLVGRGDTVVFRKAYGDRAVEPVREPMTVDTLFDLASLTKVVATTTAVMMLIEDGQLRLTDPIATFIPEFATYGKERITIRDALTHMSGLRPDLDLSEGWIGAAEGVRRASAEIPTGPPGRRFVYSDIDFVVLGEVVARVTKTPLDAFVSARVFRPLGMTETMFNPPLALESRIAPTEWCTPSAAQFCGPSAADSGRTMLRGVVHDPTARRMGGVAGHAGLFSTASDLALFCRMLLAGGLHDGARVLSPLTIARMTSPATPAGEPNVRGLGWDLDSSYSANRGDLLPLGSFGHTGFTGTSIWIDPETKVFVVFLSNRVHPDGKGDVTPLRAEVASVVASAVTDLPMDRARALAFSRAQGAPLPAAPAPMAVNAGIDVLRASGFAAVRGLRLGLLTNQTGRTRDGVSTIDLLATAPGLTVVSLFSPEHGIRGLLDAAVPSTTDEKTGLPIYSLYGSTEHPTADMLTGLDAIVIDLQDIGTRFYTYMTTMAYMLEAAAARHVRVIVLDRPNPIGGVEIEGPALDSTAVGFTGYLATMPIRHGLTMGELARAFNGERQLGVDLTVVPVEHWRREAWFDETGLGWVNPSPNMRTLYAATLYPGLGAFESTNLSVGRGTDSPFEQVGAPWIDGPRLANELNRRGLPGVRFYPVRFTPAASPFANEACQGVFITIVDRTAVRPVRLGVELVGALLKLFPGQLDVDKAARLFGSTDGLGRLKGGEDPAAIAGSWGAAEARWRAVLAKYHLY
jgi:uncharacterized protein YbbC (DUF1343 family)/CubicO group peptidase (beta-lactamase class C family)